MTTAGRGAPGTHRTTDGFFAEPLRDYVLHCLGGPVSLLQAGCLAPLAELGIGELTLGGFEISVTAVDAALLDRLLPGPARKALWSRFRPEVPGPFPAVYDKPVGDAGIASYTLMRGLVIAARGAELTLPSHPARLSSSVRVTCAAISRLTRGRFGDSHDELLYVIRKPQDRFARVV
jgi:hypothetical protein